MADFDLTQTDAQVQSILDDAQNAQGAGAQTTLTTDYIMLKDTSGNYHKILKDSFTEACRNVLAGLLVNNDKGTTISQIPAIASGDFGSVTPANLASVLGALTIKGDVASGSEINNLKTIGIWSFNNTLSGVPDDIQGGILVVMTAGGAGGGNPIAQIICSAYPVNKKGMYYRIQWGTGSAWSSWYKADMTVL